MANQYGNQDKDQKHQGEQNQPPQQQPGKGQPQQSQQNQQGQGGKQQSGSPDDKSRMPSGDKDDSLQTNQSSNKR